MRPGDWTGRRVFLTGHTGFKGSWLVMLLRELGAEVFGFSNGVPTNPSLFRAARLDDVVTASTEGDVRNLDDLARAMVGARPDIVIHMAAQALVRRSYRHPLETYATNVQGTAHLLECVRRVGGIEVVVVVTSDKVYSPSGTRTPHVESDMLGGSDPYSSSKACAELVVRSFRESYFAAGAPVVVTARAGNVIGGGDWAAERLVPDVVRAVTSGAPLEIRNPHATRPWQHVLDCLCGYLTLAAAVARTPGLPDAWNFGPDPSEARTVGSLVASFLDNTGSAVDLVAPDHPGPAEADELVLDSSRAHELLAWAPQWGIDDAIRQTADWYRRLWEGEDARTVSRDQIASHGGGL